MMLQADNNGHMLHFDDLQQMVLTGGVAARLLVAALLGGIIGLDREWHRKASGVRTNLLICFGAALFTFLSPIIAGEAGTNKAQIASNIVQGIGFLGAGLILHDRNRVSGLTSAATVFTVASIGMACGAGLYVPAAFATLVVLVTLEAIGLLETRANIKIYSRIYEVRGPDSDTLEKAILRAMDTQRLRLADLERHPVGDIQRDTFTVMTTSRRHRELEALLKQDTAVESVRQFRSWEDE